MAQCTCKGCGETFTGAGTGSKWCSDSCRPRCRFETCEKSARVHGWCTSHNAQVRQGIEPRPVQPWTTSFLCVTCGGPSGTVSGLRRFCSSACESRWRRGHPSGAVDCTICGDTFSVGLGGSPFGTKTCGKHRRRNLLRVTVAELVDRDGSDCWLCQQPIDLSLAYPDRMAATRDHVIPVTRGGAHAIDNLRLAHLSCNSRKGNRLTPAA